MRHGRKIKKLGRTASHRKALIKNLLRSLFIHERIKTTLAKAKLAQKQAERLIRYAQDKSVAHQRYVFRFLQNKQLVKHLVYEIAPRFQNQQGGYTRIFKLDHRVGDNAEMALLELTIKKTKGKEETKKT